MPELLEARSPRALVDEIEEAQEVLILSYTASLEYFERFVLASARALGALVTVISDAAMVRPDPVVVRRAGTQYLDGRALCPRGAFHPKLLVIAGEEQATVLIGSGNLTMAGWHANAEVWTALRGDADGAPQTMRGVVAFLRELADSQVTLSPGAAAALLRVADKLEDIPAEDPGPTLLSSLNAPIIGQLPVVDPVDELILYAPFHDARLRAIRRLLDHFQPANWTVFVRSDTEVDGPALSVLASDRGGHVAWVAAQYQQADGRLVADGRYWHGKLIQWRTGEAWWALTGSPNLSAPALLEDVASGGNCELALVTPTDSDLRPPEGDPPPTGLDDLLRPKGDEGSSRPSIVLLAAIAHQDSVNLALHTPLVSDGALQRYDIAKDAWRTTATLAAGGTSYEVDIAAAPIGGALRLLGEDQAISNTVFVADPERLRRRQIKAIGKVRGAPAELIESGLGQQLLSDLDELRPHLMQVGALVAAGRTPGPDHQVNGDEAGSSEIAAARPASGISIEDFLAACDPVLGQSATEFALVLPALPGVSAPLDETLGTLDVDEDSAELDDASADQDGRAEGDSGKTLRQALERATPDQRQRYRRFLERLVQRAPTYPMVVRTLAARSVLHASVEGIWPEEQWPLVLTDVLATLGAGGDESNQYELSAAGSIAAIGLALLRDEVRKFSVMDEPALRYRRAGRAVAELLPAATPEKLELLAAELSGRLAGAAGVLAAEQAVADVLHPLTGARRAAELLKEEAGRGANAIDDRIIELEEPLAGAAEPILLLALRFADDLVGPICVRGHAPDGREIIACWRGPWLVIERVGPNGSFGRAWRLPTGQTPGMLQWDELPKATHSWYAGQPVPEVAEQVLAAARGQTPPTAGTALLDGNR